MVSTLRISRQQLAAFLKNDHDAIRQFETLFNTVANPDPTATATEPEIQIETAAHEALARIERLERALGLLELAPANSFTVSDVTGLQAELDEAGGALIKISGITLASDQASLTFSDIPQSYCNLRLVFQARGTSNVSGLNVIARFNGDTGNNYDSVYFFNNSSYGNGYSNAQAQPSIGYMTGNSSISNYAGISDVLIPFYSKTYFTKMIRCISSSAINGTAYINQIVQSTHWRSTAAITSILIYPESGNFLAGSSFVLYGEK